MNLEDTLTATFVEHEDLAPDAGPVLVAVRRQLDHRRAHRAPRRMAVLAAVAVVAVLALAVAVLAAPRARDRDTALGSPSSPAGPSAVPFRFQRYTTPGAVIPADQRQAAEPISAPLLDRSGTFALAAYAGHVTVLTWDASWCGPCRNSDRGEPFRSPGPDFLTIDVHDARAAAVRYFTAHRSAAPVVFDPEGSTLSGLGGLPGALPVTVLIDRDQRVAGVFEGVVSRARLIESISRL